jgi:protein translocase SecG subunit
MWQFLFRWETLWYLIWFLYVPSCVGLIVVVLLQKGKGVGFAGAFGVGAGSDAVFGPRASKSLPQKLTYFAAATFMVLAFVMSLIAGRLGKGVAPEKLSDQVESTTPQTALDVLDDLGSGLKQEGGPVTVTPGEIPPTTPSPPPAAEAPAAPAAPPGPEPAQSAPALPPANGPPAPLGAPAPAPGAK